MKLAKNAVIIALTALVLSALQYFKTDKQKVAYVFVEDVIAECHAMQDVNDQLKLNESIQRKKLDEFYKEIQNKVDWLKENSEKLKEKEIVDKQSEIMNLEQIHKKMQQQSYRQLDSIKASWVSPVYEEVNQYIKTYSQNNGYDYVLGNLGNGNIMYGNHIHDITLKVIDGINVAYNEKTMK
jgi:Skp family chaperone for outer membrane proteins